MRRKVAKSWRLIATAIAGLSTIPALAAEDDFYKGKQIRMIVDSGPGAYDTLTRVLVRYLPTHIPGRPTFVVQNMPGASGLKATNYVYNDAPRDGTVMAAVHNGIPTAPIEAPKQTFFDVNKFGWIGSVSEDQFVGYVWHSAPIKTFEDLKTKTAVMGSPSWASMGSKMAVISNAFFGTKIKQVVGYEETTSVKLAMQKGELDGTFGNSWGDLKMQQPDWIRDKLVRIIVQDGYQKDPDLPDVPLILDQVKNEADRQALDFILERQKFARPYVTPPGLPPGRLETLRAAFDATMLDAEFLQAAKAVRLDVVRPMKGEQLAREAARLAATPTSVTDRLAKLFDDAANAK